MRSFCVLSVSSGAMAPLSIKRCSALRLFRRSWLTVRAESLELAVLSFELILKAAPLVDLCLEAGVGIGEAEVGIGKLAVRVGKQTVFICKLAVGICKLGVCIG